MRQVRDEIWNAIPDLSNPHAETLRAFTPTEATVRRRLKDAEGLRRELGQLDRGAHRACTRSPGGFSTLAAYRAVRAFLDATTLNDRGLAAVYRWPPPLRTPPTSSTASGPPPPPLPLRLATGSSSDRARGRE